MNIILNEFEYEYEIESKFELIVIKKLNKISNIILNMKLNLECIRMI